MAKSRIMRPEVGSTFFRIAVDKYACTADGFNISSFLRYDLTRTEYDYNTKTYVPIASFATYDSAEGMAYFPRYSLPTFIAKYEKYATITPKVLPPIPSRQVEIGLKPTFQLREHQQGIVDFLTQPDVPFTPLSAACGVGKTASTIAAISILHGPALIVLSMLVEQWYKEILNFTTLTPDDIVIVKGFKNLELLWKALQTGYRPKIVLFATRTLVNYCVDPHEAYLTLPSYLEFQKTIGFRTKVIDECHSNFYANTKIDLRSNIERNIYLSATYMQRDRSGLHIFDQVYPPHMRYGEDKVDRYTIAYLCPYTLSMPEPATNYFRGAKGYMHPRYEQTLLNNKKLWLIPFFEDVLDKAIDNFYINRKKDGQKLLILCRTNAFCMAVEKHLIKHYKNLKVHAFFSGMSGEYGDRQQLTDSDIIVSTINSCGTGTDIKKLKTCINTVSYNSAPLIAQVFGRLRKLENEDTYFVDLYNVDVLAHKMHANNRKNVYLAKAKEVKSVKINF